MTGLFRMVAGFPRSAAVLSVVLAAAAPAQASTIYTYTGNLFTFTDLVGPTRPADRYTTDDRITGFIELANPLAPNLGSTVLTPLSFSFSDGVNAISDATALHSLFAVETDAAGNMVNWFVSVSISAPGTTGGGTSKEIAISNYYLELLGPQVSDSGSDVLCGPGAGGCALFGDPFYAQGGVNADAAGTWQLRTTSVPEPASTVLMGAALLGFALRRRPA